MIADSNSGPTVVIAEYVVEDHRLITFRLGLINEVIGVQAATSSLKQDPPVRVVIPRPQVLQDLNLLVLQALLFDL